MKVKLTKLLLIGTSLLLLNGCGTVAGWLEDDVYIAPPSELIEFTHEFEPDVLWTVNTGEGAVDNYSNLSAWLQDTMIVTVDSEGTVNSFDNQSGQHFWKQSLDFPVVAGVGGGEGKIIVGSVEGELVALTQETGEFLWKQKLSSEILAPPKLAKGIVVARTADGRTTGVSATDGNVLWNYQRTVPLLSLRGASAPVIYEDMVIAGYANGKLVALSLTDGAVLWEKSVAVPRGRSELDRLVDIDSDPVVVNGIIYVVAYHGRLAAIRAASGDIVWARDMSSRAGLDVEQYDSVYVTDDEDNVWAVEDGSGNGLWRQTRLLRRAATAPVIVGENVIVGDYEGYVHWLSRKDGHFVARLQVADSAIQSKPIVKDNIVYITASGGKLIALRAQ
jgi:outer membrane protein assembly factor BamB